MSLAQPTSVWNGAISEPVQLAAVRSAEHDAVRASATAKHPFDNPASDRRLRIKRCRHSALGFASQPYSWFAFVEEPVAGWSGLVLSQTWDAPNGMSRKVEEFLPRAHRGASGKPQRFFFTPTWAHISSSGHVEHFGDVGVQTCLPKGTSSSLIVTQ